MEGGKLDDVAVVCAVVRAPSHARKSADGLCFPTFEAIVPQQHRTFPTQQHRGRRGERAVLYDAQHCVHRWPLSIMVVCSNCRFS